MNVLETERLELHPLDSSFCSKEYLEWINNDEVIRYLETEKGSSINDLKNYLESIEKDKTFAWAIVVKDINKHIGNIKIDPIDYKHKYGEYGIMMGEKDFWGKGYAKEASNRIISYSFEELSLRKINLGVLSVNNRALKLYESLGFKMEGILKKHKIFEGLFIDEIRMALFK